MSSGERRSWPLSIGWAVAAMAIVLALAVGVNLLIPGRVMHWDIVTIIGVGGLVAVALARRFHVL